MAKKLKEDNKDYSDADYRNMLGRKIIEGKFIAYPSMTGSSCYMNLAYIHKVWYRETEKTDWTSKTKKMVKEPRITVTNLKYGSVGPKSTLYFPSKCIVLDEEYIPESYTDLIAGIS